LTGLQPQRKEVENPEKNGAKLAQSMSRQSAKRFGDKDMLQHINLARFLFGKPIPACREAR
jgi:hypothetical protein